jgi:hypothetical protein
VPGGAATAAAAAALATTAALAPRRRGVRRVRLRTASEGPPRRAAEEAAAREEAIFALCVCLRVGIRARRSVRGRRRRARILPRLQSEAVWPINSGMNLRRWWDLSRPRQRSAPLAKKRISLPSTPFPPRHLVAAPTPARTSICIIRARAEGKDVRYIHRTDLADVRTKEK